MHLRAAAVLALVVAGSSLSLLAHGPATPIEGDVASIFTTGLNGWSTSLKGHPLETVRADVDVDEETVRLREPPPEGADAFLVRPDGVVAFPGQADLVVGRGGSSMTIHLTLDASMIRLTRHPADLGFDDGVPSVCPSRVERTVGSDSPLPFPIATGHQRLVFDVPVGEGASAMLELGDPTGIGCPEVVVGIEHLGDWTLLR